MNVCMYVCMCIIVRSARNARLHPGRSAVCCGCGEGVRVAAAMCGAPGPLRRAGSRPPIPAPNHATVAKRAQPDTLSIPHGMVSHTAWYPTQHRHGRHLQLLRFCGVWRWSMRGGAPLPTSDGYGARTSRGVRPCERASCAPAVLAAPARRVGKFVVRRGGSGAVFVDEQRAAGEVGPPCTRQVKCCMLHVACCMLHSVCESVPRCMLNAARCMLHSVCENVARCTLHVECCMLEPQRRATLRSSFLRTSLVCTSICKLASVGTYAAQLGAEECARCHVLIRPCNLSRDRCGCMDARSC